MVVLDSDHRKSHVLNELTFYSKLVTKDQYLVVEDTIINGHPVKPNFGPGPKEAVDEFMVDNDRFVVDETQGKFLLSFNHGGYLRKIR